MKNSSLLLNKNFLIPVYCKRYSHVFLEKILKKNGANTSFLPFGIQKVFWNSSYINDIMEEIAIYNWAIFSDFETVKAFFSIFFSNFKDIRSLGSIRIATLNKETALAVNKQNIQVDVISSEEKESIFLKELIDFETIENLKILLITSNKNFFQYKEIIEKKALGIVDYFQVLYYKKKKLKNLKVFKNFFQSGLDAVLLIDDKSVIEFIKNIDKINIDNYLKTTKFFVSELISIDLIKILKKYNFISDNIFNLKLNNEKELIKKIITIL